MNIPYGADIKNMFYTSESKTHIFAMYMQYNLAQSSYSMAQNKVNYIFIIYTMHG